jgi:hypothetical protein
MTAKVTPSRAPGSDEPTRTPAPQYYPVTKDELNFIKNDCIHPESDKCLDDCTAWNSKELVCDFGANILMDEVLSRQPISASSDKVLDEGIALIQKRIDGIFEAYRGETNEKLTQRPYDMADGMDEAIKMLKELRQQTKEM